MSIEYDLSVIVTAHNETMVCGPTMRAAEAAIAAAEAAGISVERIVALDCATPETAQWFNQPDFDAWTKIKLEEGDLGFARNASLGQSHGRYIAYLDADDLFSENWLLRGVEKLREADAAGQKTIVHPELNWLFDAANSVFVKLDQDDPLFSPYHFYFMNYYDSLCMAPREAHLEIPYVHRDIPAGLSFQDWQFAIETMAAGWKHVAARNTIIFKRRRDDSLLSESRVRRAIVRALEPMRIDRVADLAGAKPARPDIPARPKGQIPVDPVLPPDPRPERQTGQTPHFGDVFARRTARGWKNARKTAQQESPHNRHVMDVIGQRFDMGYYLAKNPDMNRAERMDPVSHFIRAGAKERRDPSPVFSTRAYVSRYPDVAKSGENPFYHWLMKGWAEGRIAAPFKGFEWLSKMLRLDPTEAETLWAERYTDIRQRFEYGELGAQVTKVACFDPLVERGWPEGLQVKIPPFHSEMVVSRTVAIHNLHDQAEFRPARFVICVNRARWGGARRIEGHIAHALAALYGADQVLVIATEKSGKMPEGKFPEGVRVVDFSSPAWDLKGDPRQRLLVEFVRSLGAEVVFNVNSRLLWDALTPYGTALAASTRIVACMLCNEKTYSGHWTGYPLTRFYRNFETLSAICTDSHFLARDLVARYGVPPALQHKVQVLSAPVDISIEVVAAPELAPTLAPLSEAGARAQPGRRPQVFWAGRLDPQKRIDLVYRIAAAMPHVDFRLWGESVMGNTYALPEKPDNLTREGVYKKLTDIPLEDADLWLYTSDWDGVPQMLLEVAMTGLPLVGSDVGGTSEVLQEGLARAIGGDADVAEWCTAIEAVLADAGTARQAALRLRAALLSERTEAAYSAAIAKIVDNEHNVDRSTTMETADAGAIQGGSHADSN